MPLVSIPEEVIRTSRNSCFTQIRGDNQRCSSITRDPFKADNPQFFKDLKRGIFIRVDGQDKNIADLFQEIYNHPWSDTDENNRKLKTLIGEKLYQNQEGWEERYETLLGFFIQPAYAQVKSAVSAGATTLAATDDTFADMLKAGTNDLMPLGPADAPNRKVVLCLVDDQVRIVCDESFGYLQDGNQKFYDFNERVISESYLDEDRDKGGFFFDLNSVKVEREEGETYQSSLIFKALMTNLNLADLQDLEKQAMLQASDLTRLSKQTMNERFKSVIDHVLGLEHNFARYKKIRALIKLVKDFDEGLENSGDDADEQDRLYQKMLRDLIAAKEQMLTKSLHQIYQEDINQQKNSRVDDDPAFKLFIQNSPSVRYIVDELKSIITELTTYLHGRGSKQGEDKRFDSINDAILKLYQFELAYLMLTNHAVYDLDRDLKPQFDVFFQQLIIDDAANGIEALLEVCRKENNEFDCNSYNQRKDKLKFVASAAVFDATQLDLSDINTELSTDSITTLSTNPTVGALPVAVGEIANKCLFAKLNDVISVKPGFMEVFGKLELVSPILADPADEVRVEQVGAESRIIVDYRTNLSQGERGAAINLTLELKLTDGGLEFVGGYLYGPKKKILARYKELLLSAIERTKTRLLQAESIDDDLQAFKRLLGDIAQRSDPASSEDDDVKALLGDVQSAAYKAEMEIANKVLALTLAKEQHFVFANNDNRVVTSVVNPKWQRFYQKNHKEFTMVKNLWNEVAALKDKAQDKDTVDAARVVTELTTWQSGFLDPMCSAENQPNGLRQQDKAKDFLSKFHQQVMALRNCGTNMKDHDVELNGKKKSSALVAKIIQATYNRQGEYLTKPKLKELFADFLGIKYRYFRISLNPTSWLNIINPVWWYQKFVAKTPVVSKIDILEETLPEGAPEAAASVFANLQSFMEGDVDRNQLVDLLTIVHRSLEESETKADRKLAKKLAKLIAPVDEITENNNAVLFAHEPELATDALKEIRREIAELKLALEPSVQRPDEVNAEEQPDAPQAANARQGPVQIRGYSFARLLKIVKAREREVSDLPEDGSVKLTSKQAKVLARACNHVKGIKDDYKRAVSSFGSASG